VPSAQNFFQARYAIRHAWTGPVACANPQRNVWGGPPDGGATNTLAAGNTAFAPRGKVELATLINRDLWEINYKMKRPGAATPPPSPSTQKSMGFMLGALLGLALVAIAGRRLRRARRR